MDLTIKILIILVVGGLLYKIISRIEDCIFEIEYEKTMGCELRRIR